MRDWGPRADIGQPRTSWMDSRVCAAIMPQSRETHAHRFFNATDLNNMYLYVDDIFSWKCFICDQVTPIPHLDVKLLNSIKRKNISTCFDSHDVRELHMSYGGSFCVWCRTHKFSVLGRAVKLTWLNTLFKIGHSYWSRAFLWNLTGMRSPISNGSPVFGCVLNLLMYGTMLDTS